MKRGTAIMLAGISVQIINWVLSAVLSNLWGANSESVHQVKSTLGYATIVGWLVFFAGFGIRQLDKKKSQAEPKRKTR